MELDSLKELIGQARREISDAKADETLDHLLLQWTSTFLAQLRTIAGSNVGTAADRGEAAAWVEKELEEIAVHAKARGLALEMSLEIPRAIRRIAATRSEETLENVRLEYFGRSGVLQKSLRTIGDVPEHYRPVYGRLLNEAKATLLDAVARRLEVLRTEREGSLADAEWVDGTLPGDRREPGTVHPVSQMTRELEDVCVAMGFSVLDGPWVEDEFHNFEALNIPRDHPARDSQDTFFLPDGRLLRTHTSPSQVRAMEAGRPPIRAVALGRVFRNEALDASHENTFHQVEGFVVDRDASVAHLVHVLRTLLGQVFRREVEVRLRPSFFPFTEPSFELDVRCLVCRGEGCAVCKRSGWVELLGCGLVHPNVLRAGGVDPSAWSGFAFGLGIDRLVMMRHAIEDIRHLMGGDLRFLRQFARGVRG